MSGERLPYAAHGRPLDELAYGIQVRKGLILLTSEVGMGKTTLINRVLDWLHEQQTPTAFIFNSRLEIRHDSIIPVRLIGE